MKRYSILFLVATLSFLFSCSNKDDKVISDSIPKANLDLLIKKAKEFKPKQGKVGGEIILSSFSDPKSFNPITSTETSTSEYTAYMFEGLTKPNGITGLIEPNLATDWVVSSNGLEWTFNLRRGVHWFDGKTFNANDVSFTFNKLIYNDDIPNSSCDIFTIAGKRIKVLALDSFTVKFILPVKFAPFLRSLSQEILPKHKYEPLVNNGTFTSAMGTNSKPSDIIGTGAFMLETYKPSQILVLKRNPNYWKKDSWGNSLPYLSEVKYIIVQDQNVELLKFMQGETDYLSFRGQDFPMLKRKENEGNYSVYRLGPTFGTSFLFFNQNTGKNSKGKNFVKPYLLKWFRNPLFRKAVAHAIDKESIINIAMNGLGYPQYGPMSPAAGYFFNPDVPQYTYSLDSARQILKDLGFNDKDGDGILSDKDGNIMEFSLITNSGNTVRKKIGEIINKDLKLLGFKVNFSQIEFNTLISKLDATQDWEACILGLTGGTEPHFGVNVWKSSGNLHMWYPKQKKPSTQWEKEIDDIFDKAVQELDNKKRKEYYNKWQQIVAKELPLIYTALPERLIALRNKFGNINPAPLGGLLHNLEEIYVK